MTDGLKTSSIYWTFRGTGHSDLIVMAHVSERECRCDFYRDGRIVPGEIPTIILPSTIDAESKALVWEWLGKLRRSPLVLSSVMGTVSLHCSEYLQEFIDNVL